MSNQVSSEPNIGVVTKKRRFRFLTKKRLALLLIILLVVVSASVIYVLLNNRFSSKETKVGRELASLNQSLDDQNMAQALQHARTAYATDPESMDSILALASLTAKESPDESKELYRKAFELLKAQDNPDEDGKKAITYWGAAGLAEQAGYLDRAKQYYQKVVDSAGNSDDSYEQNLVIQSREALARLK